MWALECHMSICPNNSKGWGESLILNLDIRHNIIRDAMPVSEVKDRTQIIMIISD